MEDIWNQRIYKTKNRMDHAIEGMEAIELETENAKRNEQMRSIIEGDKELSDRRKKIICP